MILSLIEFVVLMTGFRKVIAEEQKVFEDPAHVAKIMKIVKNNTLR